MTTNRDFWGLKIMGTRGIVGGVATQKKPNATANFKFGTGFFGFFSVFFWFFFGFFRFFHFGQFWLVKRVLVKWFLLVIIAFIRHSQGFIGIKCVIRQFLASLDLIVDIIFE